MARWTEEEDELLAQVAHRGVSYARKALRRQLGANHSADAVRRHGNRLGLSFRRYETCPRCGKPVTSLRTKSGLCRECNYEELAMEQRHQWEQARREKALTERGRRLKREYDKYRQRNRRK